MDYKEKYEKALERAREFQKSKDGLCVLTAESIFPELKESEDERIRKGLIKALGTIGKRNWGGIDVFESITWLKKQGEKKVSSVDFKAKDWYVSNVDGKIHDMTYHRVQPKQEWSEDDERIVTALMEGFRYHQLFNPRFGEVPNAEIISWIKSLKERLS